MAWQHISPEMTVRGFKKCCTSNAVDGDYGMSWNDIEEDGNVRSESEEHEVTDSEDEDSDTDW
jgi:hypothetical protein